MTPADWHLLADLANACWEGNPPAFNGARFREMLRKKAEDAIPWDGIVRVCTKCWCNVEHSCPSGCASQAIQP